MAAGVGVTLTGNELIGLGVLSAQHIAFSLTEACPLQCQHCIVATVLPSDKSRTMPIEQAKAYARQFPEMNRRGVRFISFTGGEPLLAREHLRLMSEAAVNASLECTVVTACHWAGTELAAARTVAEFPHIGNWHLSADVFHEEFTPLSNVVRAGKAAIGEGRRAMVRMAAAIPLSGKHLAMHESLREELPDEVDIVVQPVTKVGRGASIETEVPLAEVPAWPCMPNGMVVRYDGTVSPCCAGLVDQRTGHPFQYDRADSVGLVRAHESWRADPLLQIIRTVGFAPLLQWLADAFPDNEVLKATPRHPCDCCIKLWRDPRVGVELRRRAETPANRAKAAELTEAVFGEFHKGCS